MIVTLDPAGPDGQPLPRLGAAAGPISPTSHDSRVLVILGSSGGIGRAVARMAAEPTYAYRRIVLAYGNHPPLDVAEALERQGVTVGLLQVDLGKVSDVQSGAASVIPRVLADPHFGDIDVLINASGEIQEGSPSDVVGDEMMRYLSVNLGGPLQVMKDAVEVMQHNGHGSIVTLASIAAIGNPGQDLYAAVKAGLVAWCGSAGRLLGRLLIDVHAVCPGLVSTPMTQERMQALVRQFRGYPSISVGTGAPIDMTDVSTPEVVAAAVLDQVGVLPSRTVGVIGSRVFDWAASGPQMNGALNTRWDRMALRAVRQVAPPDIQM